MLVPHRLVGGLELPPVLTIFTQGVLSVVFGFLGLLVAVPMLAAIIVLLVAVNIVGIRESAREVNGAMSLRRCPSALRSRRRPV